MATDADDAPQSAQVMTDSPETVGPDPIIGKTIDACRVERKIGQGGMGVVYLAIHETLQQEFCIKVLNPSLVGAEDTVERFFREAQACAQLNHPNIVAIQNVGQDGEYYFIRMEYVLGKTLEEMVKKEEKLDWRLAVRLALDTAEALAHAHQKGMIHRDIKPENVMFTPKSEVKVMDFGLAKHVHSSAKVSVTGQIVGTPFFMSPEQAGGKPTDARSDIYSLGVTLYYLVTGVKPFNGKNLQEIFLKHFFYAPESPKIYNEQLPDSLCEVIRKCLKKKKKERYQSAKALARDLKAILDDPDAQVATDSDDGAARPAPASAEPGDVGDKTVVARAGGGEGGDDVDKTVRVGGQSEEDVTVRVGGGDGEEKTVAVKPGEGGRREREVSVQFRSASMVFDGRAEDASLVIEDDEEPAHAGLDLPTIDIHGMGPKKPETSPPVPGRSGGSSKQKLLVIGLLVFIPLLLYVGLEVAQRSKLASLDARYGQLVDTRAEPQAFLALADEYSALGSDEAQARAERCRKHATAEQARLEEKLRRDREAKERAEEASRRAAHEKEVLGQAEADEQQLQALREQGDFKTYTQRALAFVAKYAEEDIDELRPKVSAIRLPVVVSTDPGGADIFVGDKEAPEGRTNAQGRGVVWVPPNQAVTLRIEMKGFEPESFKAQADDFLTFEAVLQRRVLRKLSLGTTKVEHGARRVDDPLIPVHELQVDRARGGVAYFVAHDGKLHGVGLQRGDVAWTPGDVHSVGLYGDPTSAPRLVPGKVVYVGSLLGTLTAHDPNNAGQRIWQQDLGSPITSSPAYGVATRMVAVGTWLGDVVFLEGDTGQERWRFSTENEVVSTPFFLGENLAFVGSTDDRLYALDWKARRKLAELDLGSDVVVGPVPLPDGRRLVVGTARGDVHLIEVDAARPERMRSLGVLLPADEGVEAAPQVTVDGTTVYVSRGGSLHAVRVGEALTDAWPRPFVARATLTRPVAAAGLLYVGDAEGGLQAIDQQTGELVWRYEIGSPLRQAPVVLDNELYVVAGNDLIVLAAE